MKKFTMLFVLALFIKIAVGQVTVTITVKNNLSPITTVSGASVTLTGATTPTVISDASGLAVFTVPTPAVAGYFNIAVTAAGYLDFASTALVYIRPTDVTLAKTATIKKAFDISYKITDKNSVGIAGASVKVNTAPATTQTTDANGDVTFLGLYSVASHSTLVTASGYADSTFNVTISGSSLNPYVVPTVKLRNAYNLTFSVSDGTNPVAGASITIGTTTVTTDNAGVAVFSKKVNGIYAYSIIKTGYVDKTGTVTVADSDPAPLIALSEGYDIAFTIINGSTGTSGLQQDTITIDGITKITTASNKVLTFGVAPGSSYSFENKKAGFITVPVSITNIQANTAITINMVPVYTVKFTVNDFMDNHKVSGVKVNLNGTDMITDATGIVKYTGVSPSATALPFTISGPDGSNYISQTGVIQVPLTSTAYLYNGNNNISKSITYEKPYAYIGLSEGMMSYYNNATINFDGVDYAYETGMGGNMFFVNPGTYTYTVTPEDVSKAIISGTLTVTATSGASAYVNVVQGQKIEMYVTDATADQNTIEGASVTLDGVTKTTDASGYVVFNRKAINKSYAYSVSKAGFGSVSGSAPLVTADLLITTVLKTAYKVIATVYDNTNYPAVPLAGATVKFGENTAITDANGVAALPDAVNGSYDYTISKTGFVTVKGTSEITDADLNLEAWLKPAFNVQFTVTDGTNPIPNASIRLVSTWPVFDQTFVTNAQGVLLTDKLFPKWTSLEYTISAAAFADSIGTVNIQDVDLVVDPIALKRAYEITFTVTDGINPLTDAAVTINNVTHTTNAGGEAVFVKMINGDYAYLVSKPGFGDVAGVATVIDANATKTVSLATGYNLTFNVINGPDGIVGLANDTITINGISKVTDADGVVVFGVAPNANVSFLNKKTGFAAVQVDIASVDSDMSHTINMVPVYTVEIRAMDGNSYNQIVGATVVFNGITVLTDENGFARFPNIEPNAVAYGYTVSGTGTYNSIAGEILLPSTSTEEFLATNNVVSKTEYLTSPNVSIALVDGWFNYFGAAIITFDGTDYDYNSGLGFNTFNCTLGSHSYVVTPEDVTKAALRGTVELTELVQSIYLPLDVVDGHKVEIYTIDKNSDPITGAAVTISGTTVVTDESGLALFDRYPAGSYTYSVTMENFNSVAETALEVNTEDVMVIVPMVKSIFMVTIHVMSGSAALEGATVTLDGVTVTSDANGDALFTGLAADTYSYAVSKEVYTTATGELTLTDADVTRDVEILSTVGISKASTKTIKLYPNPTSGNLNIDLPENNDKDLTIRVTNIIGSILLENKVVKSSSQIKLDLSGFDNGIYFVNVKGNGFENTIKVVKK